MLEGLSVEFVAVQLLHSHMVLDDNLDGMEISNFLEQMQEDNIVL